MADSPSRAGVCSSQAGDPSFKVQVTRLRPVLWFLLTFLAIYGLAVWTRIGQSAENALIIGRADQARIFGWKQSVPPLTRGTVVLAAGVVLIVAVTVIRRCWREGIAATGIAVATVTATEALHAVLPRPGLTPRRRNSAVRAFLAAPPP